MKLEDQVVSLEFAKKIEKLGVKQESSFYWVYDSQNGGILSLLYSDACGLCGMKYPSDEHYSAFTVAELGEMLTGYKFSLETYFHKNSNITVYRNEYVSRERIIGHGIDEKNEANARAQMLIYLLENKLINTYYLGI